MSCGLAFKTTTGVAGAGDHGRVHSGTLGEEVSRDPGFPGTRPSSVPAPNIDDQLKLLLDINEHRLSACACCRLHHAELGNINSGVELLRLLMAITDLLEPVDWAVCAQQSLQMRLHRE